MRYVTFRVENWTKYVRLRIHNPILLLLRDGQYAIPVQNLRRPYILLRRLVSQLRLSQTTML